MRKSAKREKLLKKNQKEVLELKDSEKEMKSAQRAPSAPQTTQRKDLWARGKDSEMTQTQKNNEESVREWREPRWIMGPSKRTDMWISGVPEREEREKRVKNLFKGKMAENLPNQGKIWTFMFMKIQVTPLFQTQMISKIHYDKTVQKSKTKRKS